MIEKELIEMRKQSGQMSALRRTCSRNQVRTIEMVMDLDVGGRQIGMDALICSIACDEERMRVK